MKVISYTMKSKEIMCLRGTVIRQALSARESTVSGTSLLCEQPHWTHPTGLSMNFHSGNWTLSLGQCWGPLSYLQKPIKGLQASMMGWPISAHSVDIDTLLQEAIRDTEAKVIPHWILVQGHLGGERGGRGGDLCSKLHYLPGIQAQPTDWPQQPLSLCSMLSTLPCAPHRSQCSRVP